MLTAWLEYHRATLAMKCDGLTDEQLKERSVPPSSMSLLGLVRHMAEVERWWFRKVLAGQELTEIYCTEDNRDGDWDDIADADVAQDFATWRAECDAADAADQAAESLDVTGLPSAPPAAGRDPALDPHAHDRGVRPAQRPRRPAPRTDRRRHRRLVGTPQRELSSAQPPICRPGWRERNTDALMAAPISVGSHCSLFFDVIEAPSAHGS